MGKTQQYNIDISKHLTDDEQNSIQIDKKKKRSTLFRAIMAVGLTLTTLATVLLYLKTSGQI